MVFSAILGQDKAVRLLSRALAGGRLAHAYFFRGPDGVGKATAAGKMAASLLCLEDSGINPCGACRGCRQYCSGNHPDFLHIRPEGAVIKIERVRRLKKEVGYPPLEARQRVIVMEDVHTMRREAGNSLLKLLEEPPPDNVLLLTADEAEPLLQTIVSRCQIIPFLPLPLETAAGILQRQNPELDPEKAGQLAGLSAGCPGRLKTFAAGELLDAHTLILDALLSDHDTGGQRVENALATAAQISAVKDGFEVLLEILRHFFKDVMLASLREQPAGGEGRHLSPTLGRARERWNLTELSDNIQAVDFALQALARNCNRQMVAEVLFLRLLAAGTQPQ